MFKVGDTVRVLPNKKVGVVTDILDGFIILDGNHVRPYFPQQLALALQRYVLLSDNTILDTKGTEYYLYEQNKLCGGGGGVIGIIKKSSDNILDLVEVGDLVGDGDNIMLVKQYENGTFFDGDSYTCQEGFVTAIYKHQSNGDYKRYEVKN